MSGNVAEPIGEAELTKQVMEKFKVDEKTAEQIINFAVCMAIEKMGKWKSNVRKRQKVKAEEIYKLTKQIKKERRLLGENLQARPMSFISTLGSIDKILNEIEKKILELCVSNE